MLNDLKNPLVSIIIPTYNRIEYLQEAITSAINQTYENIEIIVCDNCSSENPQSLIASFNDPRIKFHRHSQNLGMFANQMYGFKIAQGKYVASLHDDDLWDEKFLAKLVPHLEANSDLILAFSDQYIIDSHGQINLNLTENCSRSYGRDKISPGLQRNFKEIALIHKSIPTAAGAVIRNSLINWDHIPEAVGGMWDLYLSYLCVISGYQIYYVPERLVKYREHEQTDTLMSGSRNIQAKIRKAKNEIFCYQVFMEDKNLSELYQHFKNKWLESHTTLGIGLLRDQKTSAARPYFWQALSQQKFNLRTIAALMLSFTPRIFTNKIFGIS